MFFYAEDENNRSSLRHLKALRCLRLLCCLCFVGEGLLDAQNLVQNNRKLHLEIGQYFSDQSILTITIPNLRIKPIRDFGMISVSPGNCLIGNQGIRSSDVLVRINGQQSISLYEAERGFKVEMTVKNPMRYSGVFRCNEIKVLSFGVKGTPELLW
jgi:hypothetical protein